MKRFLLFALFATILAHANAQDVTRLMGASPFQDSLWLVDTTNYSIVHRTAPMIAGGTITGTNGIARHPNTGVIYTINKQSGVSGRILCTYNINTGQLSLVGNLGDNFSSITFKGDSLFGVTGDGASVPETVYLINTTDATKTFYKTLGNGADGEIISYNPDDGMIYHWSGNGTIVYEKFSPNVPTDPVINIPIIGATNGETFGSVYIGNNKFLNSNISSSFNRWNTAGNVTSAFGANPDDLRGMAFITCTRQLSGVDHFCVGDSTLLTVTSAQTYQWYKDGVALSGANNDSLYVSSEGVYNCVIKDVCGTDSLGNNIFVQQNNLPSVSLSGTAEYCSGQSTTLNGSSGGTSQWYLNGVALPAETTSSILVTMPGVYNMTKTNLNGCTDSSAVGIIVVENPLPMVTLDPVSDLCIGTPSVPLNGLPAGGVYSPFDNVDPQALSAGTYAYDYIYTDTNGCADTAMISVNIVDLPLVSAGAPNTDVCIYDGVMTLTGSPAGGTFIGPGVTGTTFDPQNAGVGAASIDYNYTDGATGCSNVANLVITVDSCLSVTNFDGYILSLYPNPASNSFKVEVNADQLIKSITLFDVNGKSVDSHISLNNKYAEVNVNSLHNGTYYLTVQTANGDTRQLKVVVLH